MMEIPQQTKKNFMSHLYNSSATETVHIAVFAMLVPYLRNGTASVSISKCMDLEISMGNKYNEMFQFGRNSGIMTLAEKWMEPEDHF